MFTKIQYQTLFHYHWHTTRHLMECASKLSKEVYIANPGYGQGSLHDLLFHVLRTDRNWRQGLQSDMQQPALVIQDFPDLPALQAGFTQEQAAWDDLLGKLSATEIEGAIDLTNRRGETFSMVYWRVLQHVILHGMQHHAEIAQLLTEKGQSPGNIDFIFFDDLQNG